MASKPELLIYQSLRSLFTKHLHKGRWMLQRIETSTGVGIPDCYCSLLVNERHVDLWIETKTTEYVVSNEQLNWAATHWRAGGLTYLITRIKHTPTTRPRTPTASSMVLPYATPYPTLLLLLKTHGDNSIVPVISYDQLTNMPKQKGQETLIFLSFDDRMRECSTLGSYLRKFNPDVLPVEHWVRHIADPLSQ